MKTEIEFWAAVLIGSSVYSSICWTFWTWNYLRHKFKISTKYLILYTFLKIMWYVVLRGCTRSCLPHDCWTPFVTVMHLAAHTVWTVQPLSISIIPCNVCWTWLLWVWLCAVFVWGTGWFCRKEAEGSKMPSAVIESCLLSQLHYKVLQSDTVRAGCCHRLSNVHWHCDVHECQIEVLWIQVFCGVTPCRWVSGSRRFDCSQCLRLQGLSSLLGLKASVRRKTNILETWPNHSRIDTFTSSYLYKIKLCTGVPSIKMCCTGE